MTQEWGWAIGQAIIDPDSFATVINNGQIIGS